MLQQEVAARKREVRADYEVLVKAAWIKYGADIKQRVRHSEIVRPRHLVMWALRKRGHTSTMIAQVMRLDHSTVLHGEYKVDAKGWQNEAAALWQVRIPEAEEAYA